MKSTWLARTQNCVLSKIFKERNERKGVSRKLSATRPREGDIIIDQNRIVCTKRRIFEGIPLMACQNKIKKGNLAWSYILVYPKFKAPSNFSFL